MLLANFAHFHRWAAVNQRELRCQSARSLAAACGIYLNLICDNFDSSCQYLLESLRIEVAKTKELDSIIVL
jgi:hypothetical protein